MLVLQNLGFKPADLATQSTLLVDFMERGLPVVLIRSFASLIMLNAVATAITVAVPSRWAGFYELLLDTAYVQPACDWYSHVGY